MALPSSGPISLKQVRDELKLSGSINLGQQEVRNLANISSGRISMSDLRGKSGMEHKTVEVLNYKFTDNGYDWSPSLKLTIPNKHFLNGVIKISYIKNLGEQEYDYLDFCWTENGTSKRLEIIESYGMETRPLEEAARQFKVTIPDSRTSKYENPFISLSQTGEYWEQGYDEYPGEWWGYDIGIHITMTLEADFTE